MQKHLLRLLLVQAYKEVQGFSYYSLKATKNFKDCKRKMVINSSDLGHIFYPFHHILKFYQSTYAIYWLQEEDHGFFFRVFNHSSFPIGKAQRSNVACNFQISDKTTALLRMVNCSQDIYNRVKGL